MRLRTLVPLWLVCVVAALLLARASLQAQGDVSVQAAQHPTYGRILVDGSGRSLYLFSSDGKNTSTCYGECAQRWPPVLTSGRPSAGGGVAPNLLGTTKRQDGTLQVTYNGWPLYYYAEDRGPGDTAGQGVEDRWFLVSPYGTPVQPRRSPQPPSAATPATDAEQLARLVQAGAAIYAQNCSVCHGERGQGGAGPALAGNRRLSDATLVARQIMLGSRFMPRFDNKLSDEEVVAVATYVRNAWGNAFGAVPEDEVRRYRQ